MASDDVTIDDDLWSSPRLEALPVVNETSFEDSLLLDMSENDPLGLFGGSALDMDLDNYLAPLTVDANSSIDAASTTTTTSVASCAPGSGSGRSEGITEVTIEVAEHRIATSTRNKRLSVTGKRAHCGDLMVKRPKRPKSCIIKRNITLDLTTEPTISEVPHHSDENLPPSTTPNTQSHLQPQEHPQSPALSQNVPVGYRLDPDPITASLAARLTAAIDSKSSTNSFNQHPLRCRAATPHHLPDVAIALEAVKRAARGWQRSLSTPAPPAPSVSARVGGNVVYRQTALVARTRKPGTSIAAGATMRKKTPLTRFDPPVVPALSPASAPVGKQINQRFAAALTPLQSYMQSAL